MSNLDSNNSENVKSNACLDDIAEFLISRDEIKADEFDQLKGFLNAVLEKTEQSSPAIDYLNSAFILIEIAEN